MKFIEVEISIRKQFSIEDDEVNELVSKGAIPEIVNQKAPKQVAGWTIDGLQIVDLENMEVLT